jgi:hypothetical protein
VRVFVKGVPRVNGATEAIGECCCTSMLILLSEINSSAVIRTGRGSIGLCLMANKTMVI